MKNLFLATIFLAIVTPTIAQTDSLKTHYLRLYRNAVKYNDPELAVTALNGMVALDSNSVYKDTLSMLYFNKKSYYSSLLLSEEVVRKDQRNLAAFGRAAECYQMLGEFKTAIEYFEQIAAVTKSPYYYYQLAVSQYSIKRMAESEENCKKVLADTTSGKIGVMFVNNNGTEQAVPLNAAAKNLIGVIQLDAKNYSVAEGLFKEAIALFPKFAGAADNLKSCEEKGGKPKAGKKL